MAKASPAPNAPEPPTEARVLALAEEAAPYIVEQRRWFHTHPELSGEETRTTERIVAELEGMGIEVERPTRTGCVATVRGRGEGAYRADGTARKRILLRADIDALAAQERTGASFSSQNPGVMHACGHDAHIAMMLGAVRILLALADRMRGEARVVFQPAEEIGQGAKLMVEADVLDGMDGAFATHIWSELDAGKVSCEAGPRMASSDWFRIDVEGTSCHGALPERGADAIVAASAVVGALQTVVSRRCPALEPVLVTVGELHGGTARNVVAGSAYLTGTVRTYSEEVRARIPELMQEVSDSCARAYGCRAELAEYTPSHGAVVNDPGASARCTRTVEKLFGAEALSCYPGTLSGEDFSEYQRRVPGVFAFLGTRNPDCGAIHPQHSSFYCIDEAVLPHGAALAAQYALDFLAEE